MGDLLATSLWDIIDHPFCTVFILLISWIWVKLSFAEVEANKLALSYKDLLDRRQLYRIITSQLTHTHLVHLLLNISCIWNLRYVEINYGTWFILKYSIILSVVEAYLSTGFVQIVKNLLHSPSLGRAVGEVQYVGCSGLILAWLSFQSIEVGRQAVDAIFLLIGFVYISPVFAPIVVLCFFYLFLSRNNAFPNSSGLFAGYLLAYRFLTVLESTYWTVCILTDITVLLLLSTQQSIPPREEQQPAVVSTAPGGVRYYQDGSDGEFLEAPEPASNSASRLAGTGSDVELTNLRRRGTSGVDDETKDETKQEYDEESLLPLLSATDLGTGPNRTNQSVYGGVSSWLNNIWSGSSGGVMPTGMSTSPTASQQQQRGIRSSVQHHLLIDEEDSVHGEL